MQAKQFENINAGSLFVHRMLDSSMAAQCKHCKDWYPASALH